MEDLSNGPKSHKNEQNIVRSMPDRLVLVRHGQSQGNIIERAIRKGIISEYPPGYADIPDREIRLTDQGRAQAQQTGQWLREQYPAGFHLIYVSDYARARETCGLICQSAGWDAENIYIDPLLSERNWGAYQALNPERREDINRAHSRDRLYTIMPEGESLLQVRDRSRLLLDRAARRFSGMEVLVVSHGEYIEALWAEIAHMHTEEQMEFFHTGKRRIENCQVVEFSSIDPESTQPSGGKLRWVRSSCPHESSFGDWQKFKLKKFTPTELLTSIELYPPLDLSKYNLPQAD